MEGSVPRAYLTTNKIDNKRSECAKPEDRRFIPLNWVALRYFETFGTPLLSGRDFRREDDGGPRVAIVNDAFARYYFAGRNPIGEHFRFDDPALSSRGYFFFRECQAETVTVVHSRRWR